MKVLMVSDSIEGGGIGKVVYTLYQSLTMRGINVDIVCYQKLGENNEKAIRISEDGNRLFYCPSVRESGPMRYVSVLQQLCAQGNYDVVHIHTSLMIFLAAFAAKRAGVSCRIGHAHGEKYFGLPNWILSVFEPVGRFLNNKYCNGFVSCTERSAMYTFGHLGLRIPNYISIGQLSELSDKEIQTIRGVWDPDGECILMAYAGCMEGTKNVVFLPHVIHALKNRNVHVKLLVMGSGENYDVIQRLVMRMGLSNDVFLLGYRVDCKNILRAADYYITASTTEGMSLSLIEAQMYGKPCFASELIPTENDLGTGLFQFITSFDAETWAETIACSITNGLVPVPCSQAAAKAAEHGFSETKIISTLLGMYCQINSRPHQK